MNNTNNQSTPAAVAAEPVRTGFRYSIDSGAWQYIWDRAPDSFELREASAIENLSVILDPAQSAAPTGDWLAPTTYLQRFGDAVMLLCGGVRPADELLSAWLRDGSEDMRLQNFAIEHGPAWAQGIGLLDAARVMADQPTEGVEHEYALAAAPSATEPVADAAAMERMFHAACADLGLINEALGLDPDDGGAEPILDAIAELKALATAPSAAPASEDAVADEPVAWFVFGNSNGPVPLELYGWDKKSCLHAVLENARSIGWKGTVNGFLLAQGWAVRPVWLHPYASERAAPAAAPSTHGPAKLSLADADLLEKAITDFEDCGETDVSDKALQRFAAMGLLECDHYIALPAAEDAIEAARKPSEGGAA